MKYDFNSIKNIVLVRSTLRAFVKRISDFHSIILVQTSINNIPLKLKEFLNFFNDYQNSDEYKLGILADEIGESMDIDFDEIIQNRLNHQEEAKMMEFVKDNEIYQVLDIEKLLQDERLTIA